MKETSLKLAVVLVTKRNRIVKEFERFQDLWNSGIKQDGRCPIWMAPNEKSGNGFFIDMTEDTFEVLTQELTNQVMEMNRQLEAMGVTEIAGDEDE